MKIFAFTNLLILIAVSAIAQESKFKFGKMEAADLAMTTCESDPEAFAMVLHDVGYVKYDPLAISHPLTRFHNVAIKLFNQRGIEEYGTVEIPYYAFDRTAYITNLSANVHLPDGSTVKLKNEHFVDEQINDFYSRKKIAFPALTEGAIIEYRYQLTTSSLFSPVEWFFQREVPTRYTELVVAIPQWFDYVVLSQGYRLNTNARTTYSELNGDVVYNKWTYVGENIPALKEEKHITTMDDYYSRVRFRLNKIRIPNRMAEDVMNSWQQVADVLWGMPGFGFQLNNKRPGELVLEAAGVQPTTDAAQVEKAVQVYNWINTNIESNQLYSMGTDQEIAEILKKRSGTSSQMNKLMLAALIQLGIDAQPVFISTRSNGRVFEQYPFVDQFNHMIVRAVLDEKPVWIDLGNSLRPMGMIALNSLSNRGWVATRKDPYFTDLPQESSKSMLIIKGALNEEGLFNGEVEGRFSGFQAVNLRAGQLEDATQLLNQFLFYSNQAAPITDLEVTNADNVYQPLQIKGKLTNLPLGTPGGDRIYLAQLLPEELSTYPFKQEDRQYPVEYNYGEDLTVVFDMFLPENYVCEALPKSAKYTSEQNGMTMSLQSSQMENKISLVSKFTLKKLFYLPEEYAMLRNMYDLRKEMFSEQIVLAKAQ